MKLSESSNDVNFSIENNDALEKKEKEGDEFMIIVNSKRADFIFLKRH